MKIAVTGASGHVGSNLVRALLDAGKSVRALRHVGADKCPAAAPSLSGLDLEIVDGDVRDRASLERAFQGVELVYHLAGFVSIEPRQEAQARVINVEGVRNVVAACLSQGVQRLVHFSSIHALSPMPHGAPTDETRALCISGEAVPHYDRSKADGEREIAKGLAQGLDVVTLNPGGVLGPRDYAPSRMGQLLMALYRGQMIGLVDAGFHWVDARDVSQAALAAAERGQKGERYLLVGPRAQMMEIAHWVHESGGRRPPRINSPLWLARAAAPFAVGWALLRGTQPLFNGSSMHAVGHHLDVRNDKACRELGFAPRAPKESVLDALADFRERGVI